MLPQMVLSLLFAVALQNTLNIRGQVLLPITQSQGRMEVILEKSGAFLGRTFTDNEGHFRFINLPDGEYLVIINRDGYQELREPVNFNRDGVAVMSLTMLRKAQAEPDNTHALYANYPRNAVNDYEKALDDARKGNNAKATKSLEGIVKGTAYFQEAHNALGTLYQKAQRFQDAEKEYNAAVQLDPYSSEPLVNLGSLYIQIAEQSQAKRDTETTRTALDGAVRALNQAIRVQPDSAKAYYFLGTAYYKGGQFAKAEVSLMHSLQLENGMNTAELVLANVYIKQQKWKQALEFLDAYLRDNPLAADREQIEQTRAKVAAQK